MKNTMKKFASMLLVLAMLLSLSVTAFATDNTTDTVTLIAKIDGFTAYQATVNLSDTVTTVRDVIDTQPDLEAEWNGAYLKSLMGAGSEKVSDPQNYYTPDEDQTVVWSSSLVYPGYGFLGTEVVDGKTAYHYVYVGIDWTYTVNGQTPNNGQLDAFGQPEYEYTMGECTLQGGQTIELNYGTNVNVFWTFDALNSSYPYLP